MTTQYEGLDIWSETFDIPTDDDVRDASSYSISAIGLGDRTRYIKNRGFYSTPAFGGTHTNSGTYRIGGQIIFTNSGGIAITYASAHTFTRVAHLHVYADPTFWSLGFNFVPPKGHYRQLEVTTNPSTRGLVFDFDLPSNCTVTRVAVRVQPEPHVALPDEKPTIEVYLADVVAGTTTLIGTGTDPSLTIAAYNALHVVELTFSQAFDAGKHRLFAKVYGERDTVNLNAVIGLLVFLPVATFTRAQIGEEFGELVP